MADQTNPIIIDGNVEENADGGEDNSSTPLKKYVTFVGDKKDGKWTCTFQCKKEPYTGSYSRIRAHLIGLLPGQKSQGVALCSKLTKQERQNLKKEEEEARKLFGSARKTPIQGMPVVPPLGKSTSSFASGSRLVSMFNTGSRSDVDSIIARCFYANGVPFNLARSPFWYDMIRAVNEAPKGYKPPSAEKIRTVLLDKEKNQVEKALMPLKEQWPTYGLSIVSDGWTNIKNQTLINVMAISGGRAMFLASVDCSGDEKTGEFISKILLDSIESVGTYNVVQVLTDNASNCKLAGEIIEARYRHIFWSGCMAHTLSLLMKDIAKSPNLGFVSNVYDMAKNIVKYVKNHSKALYIFRAFSALDVLQVKKTRFGSHYVLLERVVRVRNSLLNMVLSDDWEKIKKGQSKVEHELVMKTILDNDFWEGARIVLSFTKPIWVMIRFCDSDKAIIGEVYQKMSTMVEKIKQALVDYEFVSSVVEILAQSRWEKMNRPLHSFAYVLTPYYYSQAWLAGM